jgi:hypothetical protein
MTLAQRLLLVAACFAVGLILQAGLSAHLSHTEAGIYPQLRGDLESLPLKLASPAQTGGTADEWLGVDRPGLDDLRARLDFADGLVSRHYQSQANGQIVDLYMVYSRLGEDRKHHPEICIREVAGAPEDLSARGQVALDAAGERRVQRFRFRTGTSESTLVYYWHYTLDPELDPRQTFLQRLHLRLRQAAPSITVQVSTLVPLREAGEIEKKFLPALDRLLQNEYLPPTARIGCERLPIGLVRE